MTPTPFGSNVVDLPVAPPGLATALVAMSFVVSAVIVTVLAVTLPLLASMYALLVVTTTATAMAAPETFAELASAVVLTVFVLDDARLTSPLVALIVLLPETFTLVSLSTTETANAAFRLLSLPALGVRLLVTLTVLVAFRVTLPLLVIVEPVTLTVAFWGERKVPLMMSLKLGAPTNAPATL